MRLNPRLSSAFAAQSRSAPAAPEAAAAAAPGAQLVPVSTTLSPTVGPADIPSPHLQTTPATEIYTAKRGESIPAVAHKYLNRTAYQTSSELSEAIRRTNGKDLSLIHI